MNTLRIFLGIAFFAIAAVSQSYAGKVEVVGKVTTFNKYPLKNVVVSTTGEEKSATTDSEGNFKITCDSEDKLIIRANGFVTKKVSVELNDSDEPIQVNLRLKDGDRNFELATVYGHISEETLSHAIDLVDSNLEYCSYNSILDILREKENRVRANDRRISISGMRGAPLLIVDGSEVQYSYFKSIPTTDIESIAVLGHTASARYGMKGYSGVIEVVTK
ncbi:carboxypeptidase-like regulatory domain-containing protein [Maribellus sediminis]|uniref:carboxypeptidase-like regulatory domain-containing protein n=1 Tax=Maribellus sediminis TaxID=2696285 RepID=UPI00142F7DBB|nr:carboxypeptidase-like regulatory domain-containing protein [Maribellus sediminis]